MGLERPGSRQGQGILTSRTRPSILESWIKSTEQHRKEWALYLIEPCGHGKGPYPEVAGNNQEPGRVEANMSSATPATGRFGMPRSENLRTEFVFGLGFWIEGLAWGAMSISLSWAAPFCR